MVKRNYFTLDDLLKITDFETRIIVRQSEEDIFKGFVKQFYQSEIMKNFYNVDVVAIKKYKAHLIIDVFNF